MDARLDREGRLFFLLLALSLWPLALGAAEAPPDPLARSEPSAAPEADADEDRAKLDEVTVTVRGREEELRKVPFTVQVLGGDGLERRGESQFLEYADQIPGVTWNSLLGGNGQRVVFRGITSGLNFSQDDLSQVYLGVTPIATHLADDALGIPPDPQIVDVDRIEVLRGPQGTYFGANAVGGVVRILPREPDLYATEGWAGVSASHIEHGGDGYQLEGAANLPLVEGSVALRAAGFTRQQEGWIDDPGLGLTDLNSDDSSGGRLALRLEEGALRIDTTVAIQHDVAGGLNDELASTPYQQARAVDESTFEDWTLFSVAIRYDGTAITFESNTSYFDRRLGLRGDGTVYVAVRAPAGATPPPASWIDAAYDSTQVIQEFRLLSAGARRWDWIAGAYFQHSETRYALDTHSPGFDALNAGLAAAYGYPDVLEHDRQQSRYDEQALFADATWRITGALELGAGDRWQSLEAQRYRIYGGLFGGGTTETEAESQEDGHAPRLSLRWSSDARWSVYGMLSEGFRPGGPNAAADLIESTPACDADLAASGRTQVPDSFVSDSFMNRELGAKTRWLDQRLSVNLTVFDIAWRDMQVPVDLGNCGLSFVDNAGAVDSKGLELELAAYPAPAWAFDLNWALLDARFADDVPDLGVVAGDRVANVPYYTAAAGADWYYSGHSFLRLQVTAVGDRSNNYAFPGNFAPPVGAYAFADLRAVHEVGAWQYSVEVSNLTDARADVANINWFGEQRSVFLPPRTLTLGLRREF